MEHDSAVRKVGDLTTSPALTCPPTTTVREVAQLMSAARRRSIVVPLPGGQFGIFTDGDMRRRIVAAGVDTDRPISQFLTTPIVTADRSRRGADVLMDMLDEGLRQMPVVTESGALVGVIEDSDLYAPATRSGFALRSDIARAADPDELATVCARVPSLVVALHDARVSPVEVTAVYSILVDAAVRRAVSFAFTFAASAPTWMTLGSVARREALPSSDVESALILTDRERGGTSAPAEVVHALLDRCGFRRDPNHALASYRRFARTTEQWSAAIDGWIADPLADRAVVMLSLLADSVVIAGPPPDIEPIGQRIRADHRAGVLMLRESTNDRARLPMRDKLFRRSENADVKAAVVGPITGIARWAGAMAGTSERTTLGRLSTAADAKVLSRDDAAVLAESFEVAQRIRLQHQCEQIQDGYRPDNVVPFDSLTPLARSLLANAVREVSGVQRTLAYVAGTTTHGALP